METNLTKLISSINDIDKALDAYEYNGYTYEEYVEMKDNNIRGNRSIRKMIKYNSNGSRILASWMEEAIERTKKMANTIWLCSKGKYTIKPEDIKEINFLVDRLDQTNKTFIKNTDNLSLYPIQSESISDNLNNIINILKTYTNNYETDY